MSFLLLLYLHFIFKIKSNVFEGVYDNITHNIVILNNILKSPLLKGHMTTLWLFLPADSPHPLPGSNVPCHVLHHIWPILTHIHSVWRVSSAQVWWTGRCWTRWSAATGCPVPPSAPNPCTSWCWPAGARSPRSGPPSNTSRASWKTTSPPLNHSTSQARTSRDADPVKCESSEKDIISPYRENERGMFVA